MSVVNMNALVAGPVVSGDPLSLIGVARYTSSDSDTLHIKIPANLHGRFIKIKSMRVESDYAFSVGGPADLVKDQLATVEAGSAEAGDTLDVGEHEHVIVPRPPAPNVDVYLNVISSGSNGLIIIRNSTYIGDAKDGSSP